MPGWRRSDQPVDGRHGGLWLGRTDRAGSSHALPVSPDSDGSPSGHGAAGYQRTPSADQHLDNCRNFSARRNVDFAGGAGHRGSHSNSDGLGHTAPCGSSGRDFAASGCHRGSDGRRRTHGRADAGYRYDPSTD